MIAGTSTAKSGMYWIDPDGVGVGDEPIYVHCDLETGVTSVLHDAEIEIPIPVCADTADCYIKDINYSNATVKQMTALAELSENCHQTVKIDCMRGPLEWSGANSQKQYSTWLDRKKKPQKFWSGNGPVHRCQCGIEKNCLKPNLMCNCDANVAIPLTDSGKITNKNLLPITGLRFSNTKHEGGRHKLGRFECSGLQEITTANGRPQSCEDLWRLGQTINDLYFFEVVRPTPADLKLEVYYCDFQASTVDGIPVKGELLGTLQGLLP